MKIKIVFSAAVVLTFWIPTFAKASKNMGIAELMETSRPGDWRAVDPENTVYIELSAGRVIVELNPDFAPKHINNVKQLAHSGYWDGLAVVRVQDNYVVQWADPNAEKPELKRKIRISLETSSPELDVALNTSVPFHVLPDRDTYASEAGFSNGFAVGRNQKEKKMWLLHCYGAVGVGRDNPPESGDGTELYAVIGHAPRHLDRNVTVIGRVLQGIEFFSSLPRGHGKLGFYEKPEQNVSIKSIKMANELPENQRVALEVLRTDTLLFDKIIEARRHRHEEWFHYSSGHVDICNFPIPVREKKSSKN